MHSDQTSKGAGQETSKPVKVPCFSCQQPVEVRLPHVGDVLCPKCNRGNTTQPTIVPLGGSTGGSGGAR